MRAAFMKRDRQRRSKFLAGIQLWCRRPRLVPTVAAVLATALVAGAGSVPPAAASPTVRAWAAGRPAARPSAHGRVEILHLPSGDADRRPREVWVYRPPGPDRADLPVVYFLHGYPGGDHNGESIGLPALLDRAFVRTGRPFVVVLPDGGSAIHPDTEWTDSVDGKVQLERFVTGGLLRAVEGHHPRDRHHRAIAGFSMGGYGAMNIGLHHPTLYSQIVSIAGYFHPDDPDRMGDGQARWAADNSPDRRLGNAHRTRLLVVDDARERDPLIQGEASRFAGLARAAGLHPTLAVAPGAHDWSMVASQMPTVVGFLDAGWGRHSLRHWRPARRAVPLM
jgi:S-formylglutathione hydrolase FrmB